ncbi:LLM class flavin-dependent oxidoreductase [Nonomuraea sp. B5E05]|uniref:LLM class flavin-dependent oxidoreductase n=1 Tax=Nonomuraea sp. B5E05 TaxID=3153569 RepID=UPI003260C957
MLPSQTDRPFRFGIALHMAADRREWRASCRRAEQIGFDTIAVIDHLGKLAPFPALALAAEATERVRLGTYVLDATFHSPALLVRDVASTDLLTGGRLEIGLAAGRPSAGADDLRQAGMPYPTRVAFVRTALKERITQVELNHEAPAVVITTARRQALDRLRFLAPSLTTEELGNVPGILVGTPAQIAEQIRSNRAKFGFTYITVLDGGLDGGLDAMALVIELLR